MNCANCGTALPEGANYCPKCGALASAQTSAQPAKGMPRWLIILLIVAALLVVSVPFFAILAAILIPNFLHARSESMTLADKSNLKQIATALEEYAVDHKGAYPANLPQLIPLYVTKLPVVPGGDNTGAYDYHPPAAGKANYEIWDDGSMDPTTLGSLPVRDGGGQCGEQCKYVVYIANKGIVGVAGQQR